jgi:hypothetical protein
LVTAVDKDSLVVFEVLRLVTLEYMALLDIQIFERDIDALDKSQRVVGIQEAQVVVTVDSFRAVIDRDSYIPLELGDGEVVFEGEFRVMGHF